MKVKKKQKKIILKHEAKTKAITTKNTKSISKLQKVKTAVTSKNKKTEKVKKPKENKIVPAPTATVEEEPWYSTKSTVAPEKKTKTFKKRVRRTKEELKDVYIDPIEMERLIIEYYKTDILSDKLAEMVQMIANRLALARNFYSYSFKTEMQGDAIIKMVTALRRKRFKCGVGYNPFSYFTKVAYHAFQNCIKKHKRDFDTLKRYQQEVYEDHVCTHNLSCRKNTRHHENSPSGD